MMMRGIFPVVLISLGFAGAAQAQTADEPKKLGGFKDWQAFTYKAPDSKVCFAFSEPKKSQSTREAKRDPIRFIVTNYPGRKVKGQISTIIGYPFKKGSTVKLSIDDKEFTLYPVGDMAWAEKDDADIVAAMKDGTSLTVAGTSWKGTQTTDSYSLAGISAAIDEIDGACK
jgi:invasion protein IalB